MLIEHPSTSINAFDLLDNTPFILASATCSPSAVDLLLGHPDVNLHVADKLGRTALHLACSSECTSIVKILLERAPELIKRRDSKGTLPLFIAVWTAQPEILLQILAKEEADLNAQTADGSTALTLSIEMMWEAELVGASGDKEFSVFKLISTDFRTDVDVKRDNGDSPLHAAAFLGSERAVTTLLRERGLDVNIWARNKRGFTAMDYAAFRGQQRILNILKQWKFYRDQMDSNHLMKNIYRTKSEEPSLK